MEVFERHSTGWKIAAIVVVFFVSSGLTATIVGDRGPHFKEEEAQFTEREEALRRAVEPRLEAMVLRVSDLGDLSHDLNDCTTSGGSFSTVFELGNDASGESQLKRAEVTEESPPLSTFASFCDENFQLWVSSLVELPRDKKQLLFWATLMSSLAEGEEEALRKLVAADNSITGSGFEPGESAWLDVQDLGDGAFAFRYDAYDPGWQEDVVVYDFTFTRGLVWGSLSMIVPAPEASDSEAVAAASRLDDKIQVQFEALSADARAD
jgi:hypothetical protein